MILICLKKKEPTLRQLRKQAKKYLKNLGYKTKKIFKKVNTDDKFMFFRIVKDEISDNMLKGRVLWLNISSLRERGIKETVNNEITDLLINTRY